MSSKTQTSIRDKSVKKRGKQKSFTTLPVDLSKKKSCRIDRNTVIFIGIDADCETEKIRYWKTHLNYEAIYNSMSLGGRRKKIKQ